MSTIRQTDPALDVISQNIFEDKKIEMFNLCLNTLIKIINLKTESVGKRAKHTHTHTHTRTHTRTRTLAHTHSCKVPSASDRSTGSFSSSGTLYCLFVYCLFFIVNLQLNSKQNYHEPKNSQCYYKHTPTVTMTWKQSRISTSITNISIQCISLFT